MSQPQRAITEEIERPSQFPFQAAGTEQELYPPMCLRSHWDPTAMLNYILPNEHVGLPMDFRPYVKVCKNYVTSGPAIPAPLPPKDMVFPSGGEFYPPGRYANNIDRESVLFDLDRPLDRWCQVKEYVPPTNSDMYIPNSTVPRRQAPSSSFVTELAMPQSVLREGPYACRSADDAVLWARSPRVFNNPTKQDRYGAEKYYALPNGKLVFPHGEAQPVPLTHQAQVGADVYIPRPGGDGVAPGVQGSIRPLRDTMPDRNQPVRIAGLSTVGSQAPA